MKKATTLITLFLLTISFYGQSKKSLLLHLNVGTSISNFAQRNQVYRIDVDNHSKPIQTKLLKDALYSFTLGVGVEYFINDQISINSGFSFEKKGLSIHYDSTRITQDYKSVTTFENKIKNHYCIVPLTLRKYFFQENSLYVEAGIYGGILLTSHIHVSDYITRQHSDRPLWYSKYTYDGQGIKGHTTKFDVGLSLGTGYKKAIASKLWLTAQLKFNLGLSNIDAIYNNEVVYNPSGSNLNNESINNYYGINSNAKNLNMTATIGMAYQMN